MSGFSFGGIRANATKKDLAVETLSSPLIHKTGSGLVPILMGEYVPGRMERFLGQVVDFFQETLEAHIDSRFPHPGFSYLCGLRTKHATLTKPLDADIAQTYARSSWRYDELLQHMNDDCPFVFASGRGLYSITQTDELQTRFFYDVAFNKSYFYSPDLQKFIFPIDHLPTMLRRFRTNFQAKGTHDRFIIDPVVTGTDPKTKVADVYQTNFALHQLIYAFTYWDDLQTELEVFKNTPRPRTEIVTNPKEIAHILNSVGRQRVAMDIETSGFDFAKDRIGDFSMALNAEVGYYFPWDAIVENEEPLAALHNVFRNAHIVGANFKFDMKFIRKDLERRDPKKRDWGPKVLRVDDDVIQAGHVLNEMRFNSLKTLSWLYTPFGGYNKDLDEWKRQHPNVDSYLDIPDEIRIPYAGMDAAVTYAVMQQQLKQFETVVKVHDDRDKESGDLLPQYSMYHYYSEIMMSVVNMLCDVEYRGVETDTTVLEEQYDIIIKNVDNLRVRILDQLSEEAGGSLPPFDIGSPTQLGRMLEEVGWPCIKRNKAGVFQTDGDSLDKWEYMGYEAATMLKEYRSWVVAIKSFIGNKAEGSGWWQYLRRGTDDRLRMHATFAPMRADSGRHKCRAPNLQNIPSHGKITKHAKAPLCPPSEDYYISSMDFASFQLRIAAIHSQDPSLLQVYSKKKADDLHSVTAYRIFGERKFDVVEVDFYDQKGKKHTLLGHNPITVTRADGTVESTTAMKYNYLEGDEVSW